MFHLVFNELNTELYRRVSSGIIQGVKLEIPVTVPLGIPSEVPFVIPLEASPWIPTGAPPMIHPRVATEVHLRFLQVFLFGFFRCFNWDSSKGVSPGVPS